MIFDTHCHLNHEDLYKDLDNVINRAKEVGVSRFLVVGYDKPSSLLAVKLAEQYDFIYAAIGYHPTEINNLSEDDFNEIMDLLDHPKVVALGEIGLDYYWVKDLEERELQKKYFIRQIKEANKHRLPICIHNRDAINDCLTILKENHIDMGGVMHCYSGSVEIMNEFIKCGMYISLGGPVTFKNAKTPKEVAKIVPLDKLLVETDSPYLAPHPYRGKQNEPSLIPLVIEEIALQKGLTKDEIEDATYANASKLFHV